MHKAVITITDCIRFLRIEHHIAASQTEKRKVNWICRLKKRKKKETLLQYSGSCYERIPKKGAWYSVFD